MKAQLMNKANAAPSNAIPTVLGKQQVGSTDEVIQGLKSEGVQLP